MLESSKVTAHCIILNPGVKGRGSRAVISLHNGYLDVRSKIRGVAGTVSKILSPFKVSGCVSANWNTSSRERPGYIKHS